jgi:hypothetical protein
MSIEKSIIFMATITLWLLMRAFYRELEARKDPLFSQDLFMLELKNMLLYGVEIAELIGNISI